MRVVVPTPEAGSVASRALQMERITHEECVVEGDTGYSELICHVWEERTAFILVEHDIVPWPGALNQLATCEHPWCTFPYPVPYTVPAGFHPGMAASLGCVKFGAHMLRESLPSNVEGAPWWQLDNLVITGVGRRGIPIHIHEPGVAHVRTHWHDKDAKLELAKRAASR